MATENQIANNLNVSASLGKLMDYSGKKVSNDTNKESIEPYSRVSLPSGNHQSSATGYGLILETRTGKLIWLVQFATEEHGTVMISRSQTDFEMYTNSKGIYFEVECGEPNEVNGNRYTNVLKITKM